MNNFTPEQRKIFAAKSVATRQANIAKRKAEQEEMLKQRDWLYQEIKALEEKLAQIKSHEAMHYLSKKVTGKGLLRHDQIVESAKQWQELSGVYFLVDEDKVIYVGQSVNIYSRIPQHHDKKFDKFTYVLCEPRFLNIVETLYIHCLQPKLNFDRNGNLHAPLTFEKLLEQQNDMAIPTVPKSKTQRSSTA